MLVRISFSKAPTSTDCPQIVWCNMYTKIAKGYKKITRGYEKINWLAGSYTTFERVYLPWMTDVSVKCKNVSNEAAILHKKWMDGWIDIDRHTHTFFFSWSVSLHGFPNNLKSLAYVTKYCTSWLNNYFYPLANKLSNFTCQWLREQLKLILAQIYQYTDRQIYYMLENK